MRTTITLEADVEELVNQAMQERGLTFKAAFLHGLVDEFLYVGFERDGRTHASIIAS